VSTASPIAFNGRYQDCRFQDRISTIARCDWRCVPNVAIVFEHMRVPLKPLGRGPGFKACMHILNLTNRPTVRGSIDRLGQGSLDAAIA